MRRFWRSLLFWRRPKPLVFDEDDALLGVFDPETLAAILERDVQVRARRRQS